MLLCSTLKGQKKASALGEKYQFRPTIASELMLDSRVISSIIQTFNS